MSTSLASTNSEMYEEGMGRLIEEATKDEQKRRSLERDNLPVAGKVAQMIGECMVVGDPAWYAPMQKYYKMSDPIERWICVVSEERVITTNSDERCNRGGGGHTKKGTCVIGNQSARTTTTHKYGMTPSQAMEEFPGNCNSIKACSGFKYDGTNTTEKYCVDDIPRWDFSEPPTESPNASEN